MPKLLSRTVFLAGLLAALAPAALAGDLAKIDRTIKKEPKYSGKPGYALLVFGPDAKSRAWLVHDGNTLYVDRNGNGDLTEPGKAVRAEKGMDPEEGYSFHAGELNLGGKIHKDLVVDLPRIKQFQATELRKIPAVQKVMKDDPNGLVMMVRAEIASERFKGAGVGERLLQIAGPNDLAGVLRLGERPADAPIIHLDGPLQVTFYSALPTLRIGREQDMILTVGTPGVGPGSFAMLVYQDTIPADLNPGIEINYPPAGKDGPRPRETYELKERC